MNLEELKDSIKKNIKFEVINPPKTGGQTVGIIYNRQRLHSEELDLTLETGHYRSALKNRELLATLFELTLDELVK